MTDAYKTMGFQYQTMCFFVGQGIMLLNVCSGILSKYLSLEKASLPTLQSTFLYVTLGVVYMSLWFVQNKMERTGVPIYFYLLLAIVDVEANYFAVKAFNYANYVTAGLLLNLTIPCATIFCYIFLKTRYSMQHYLGAGISISGAIVIFIADYSSSYNSTTGNELRGDSYSVMAAILYATSNVMIEHVVKVRDMKANTEILGFMGMFASIVSIAQVLILEYDPIKEVEWNAKIAVYMVAFVAVLFTFYTIATVFLRWAEALMFNLSLLTGPVFAVIASYWLFDEPLNTWYWLALALFYVGLTLYTLAGAPKETKLIKADANEEIDAPFRAMEES